MLEKGKNLVKNAKNSVVEAIDQNRNGEIDIEDVILLGVQVPGVKINRANFLQAELSKHYPQEVIDKAIETRPSLAGIDKVVINMIADEVIEYERKYVSGITAALGMPGGLAMLAIPADIAQYYGYMLRVAQKLLYLYGFPEMNTAENNNKLDSETLNKLILCIGTMYGTAGASNAIKGLANGLGQGLSKQFMNTAVTKGTLYPIIKKVGQLCGVKVTKKLTAKSIEKTVPIIGGIVGGGLTYATFKPCCVRLKDSLKNTLLADPNYQVKKDEVFDFTQETNEE